MQNIALWITILLVACIGATRPPEYSIEIDTAKNELTLLQGYSWRATYSVALGYDKPVTLNNKVYRFNTPKGHFVITKMAEEPEWIPPDWYYHELGITDIPAIKDRPRIKGHLGKYAMYLNSEGIMIHGTDNESTIGQNVSHGCVRMKKGDLKEVYTKVHNGTKVYIY